MKMNPTTWLEKISIKSFQPLTTDMQGDVVIVGAGLTGILSAYKLAKSGKKVIVVEKNKIGEGVSALTTAFLSQSIDTDFSDLISSCGEEKAKIISHSHGEATAQIKQIVDELHIECEYKECSNFIYASSEKDLKMLQQEYDAAKKLGLNVELHTNSDEASKILGFKVYGLLDLKHQAKFHPLKFISKVVEECEKLGVVFYEQTEVKNISEKAGKVFVSTDNELVTAEWAISATYSPFGQPLRVFFKKGMYVSYVFEIETDKSDLVEGTYEDTYNPYHYFRVDKIEHGFRIVVGGEDHRQDIPVNENKNFNALQEFVDELLKGSNYNITKQWSGPILEPVDGLAFIGPISKKSKVLYAFGYSGNGMTYASIASTIFNALVQHQDHPWISIYRASRFPGFKALLVKGRDFSGELLGGALKNFFSQKSKFDINNT